MILFTRDHLKLVLMVLLVGAILFAAPFVGPALPPETSEFIFWQLRMPRMIMAVLVGGLLSLVGAVYQTLFSNPLAAPSTVGTTAGATLGALLSIVYGGHSSNYGVPLITLSAFVGALGVSITVMAIAASGRVRINDIILAGIACSLATGAIASGVQYSADVNATMVAVQWSLGHLPQVGYRSVVILTPIVVLTSGALLSLIRSLDSLAVGEEIAYARGVNIARIRAVAIGFGSLGVAACVAWCGPIAFVELIVPHIVRLMLGTGRRVLLPMSIVVGGAFLALCDTATRVVLPGRELPVGTVTAALGAPMLVYLIARQSR